MYNQPFLLPSLLFAFLTLLFIFLSILHIIVVLPSPPISPIKTKTIRIHVFWTRWWSCVEKKFVTVLNYASYFVVGRYKFWLGMFFWGRMFSWSSSDAISFSELQSLQRTNEVSLRSKCAFCDPSCQRNLASSLVVASGLKVAASIWAAEWMNPNGMHVWRSYRSLSQLLFVQ